MRKRLMNISKRCMVAIMSAAFVMSSVTVSMAIPVGVYALDNEDNNVYIASAIDTNTGTGVNVLDTGSVQTNSGGIHDNNGTVVNNTGVIENNFGTVTNNYGTIESNISGNIMNQYDGTVQTGFGTITNYFGGNISDPISPLVPTYVTNNFADITADTPAAAVSAPNQYRSVSFEGADEYESFDKAIESRDGVGYYVKADGTGKGTIIIKPESGKELSRNDGDVNNGTMTSATAGDYTFTYSLTKNEYGGYTLNITNYSGNLGAELNMDMFNIISHVAQQYTAVNITSVNVTSSDNVAVADNSTSSQTATPAPTFEEILAESAKYIENKIDGATVKNGIIDLDLGEDPAFTAESFMALVDTRTDVEKKVHFTSEGKRYVFTVPGNYIDKWGSGLEALTDQIKWENLKIAGPLRITQLIIEHQIITGEWKNMECFIAVEIVD